MSKLFILIFVFLFQGPVFAEASENAAEEKPKESEVKPEEDTEKPPLTEEEKEKLKQQDPQGEEEEPQPEGLEAEVNSAAAEMKLPVPKKNPPQQVTDISISDKENDAGANIAVSFKASSDEKEGITYVVSVALSSHDELFFTAGSISDLKKSKKGKHSYKDGFYTVPIDLSSVIPTAKIMAERHDFLAKSLSDARPAFKKALELGIGNSIFDLIETGVFYSAFKFENKAAFLKAIDAGVSEYEGKNAEDALKNLTEKFKKVEDLNPMVSNGVRRVLNGKGLEDARLFASQLKNQDLAPLAEKNIGTEIIEAQKEIIELIKNEVRNGKVIVKVEAKDADVFSYATATGNASENYFNNKKITNLVFTSVICFLIWFLIRLARKGMELYLRKIGGLDAVEDAIGRCTEMGKPVLFVHGLKEMDNPATIAAVNILGQVAKKVAEYDTSIKVCNIDPVVTGVSQEVVEESYLAAGRPDNYQKDSVMYVAADQFSYVAAINGMMVRDKPAANLYMGHFYAESLLLAETGSTTGAIQIAGTDSYTQIPFFITTCDYTLIGEELFAASAYLSREPMLLGSIKGQDYGKLIVLIILLMGTLLLSLGLYDIRTLLTG